MSKQESSFYFLDKIFRRENKDVFTEKSLFYQEILRYFASKSNDHSSSWDLNEWLQINHKAWADRNLDKNMSQKQRDDQGRVDRYLDELFRWQLIEYIEKPNAKNKIVKNYKPTFLGHLIGVIINEDYIKNIQKSHDDLFTLLKFYFEDKTSSLDKFCLIFLQEMKNNDLFKHYYDYFKQKFLFGSDIGSEIELFTKLILQRPSDTKTILEKFEKTYNELSLDYQLFFCHHIKLFFEIIMQSKTLNLDDYEEFRYIHRIEESVCIEMHCKKCNQLTYINLPFLIFIRSYFDTANYSSYLQSIKKDYNIEIKCETCNSMDFDFPLNHTF